MNTACGRQWTRKFLSQNLPISFINKEFRPHLAAVQFELEKSRLPSSQITMELENNVKQLGKEENEIKEKMDDLRRRLSDIGFEKAHMKARLQRRYRGEQDTGETGSDGKLEGRAKFMRACPSNDCRGFLSTQWKCGTCEKFTCPDCHEVKGLVRDAEHVCDPNTLASAQAIAKDSKHCPNCSAMIFKIMGCNHMFCTACNTGFDWKTGKLIRGAVGNPHYYDYIANANRNGANLRQPVEGQCNALIDLTRQNDRIHGITSAPFAYSNKNMQTTVHTIQQLLRDALVSKTNELKKTNPGLIENNPSLINRAQSVSSWVRDVLRNIAHNEEILLDETFSERNEYESMEYLRVKYLRKEIDDDQFRKSIQKHTQKAGMKREYRLIVQMANEATKDIVARMIRELFPACNEVHSYIMANVGNTSINKRFATEIVEASIRALAICNEYNTLCQYVNELAGEVVSTYHSTAMPYKLNNHCGFERVHKK